MIWWSVWKARNEYLWQNKISSVSEVAISAKRRLDQWVNAQKHISSLSSGPVNPGDGLERWIKLSEKMIKVNVDAAVFIAEGNVGLGIIARDDAGELLAARGMSKSGSPTPEMTEVLGVTEALS